MLMDVLGVMIGFVTIVLLLSILVTAIVQTLSSLTRLRNRTLVFGLELSGLQKVLTDVVPPPPAQDAKGNPDAKLIEVAHQVVQRPLKDKRITWIEDKELIEPLKAVGVSDKVITLTQAKLDETRRRMEDKYLQWARGITFVSALLIAGIFQASAPELLRRLQNDEQFRLRAEAMGEDLVRQPSVAVQGVLRRPEVVARSAFLERHPEHTAALGELTFEPRSVDDLVSQFETALDAEPDRDALAAEYRELLEQALRDSASASLAAARESTRGLAALDIRPLADPHFYWEPGGKGESGTLKVGRIAGVLFMAVLLSFGAPFWYKILKELVGLKDALRKKVEPEDPAAPPQKSGG